MGPHAPWEQLAGQERRVSCPVLGAVVEVSVEVDEVVLNAALEAGIKLRDASGGVRCDCRRRPVALAIGAEREQPQVGGRRVHLLTVEHEHGTRGALPADLLGDLLAERAQVRVLNDLVRLVVPNDLHFLLLAVLVCLRACIRAARNNKRPNGEGFGCRSGRSVRDRGWPIHR